MHVSSVGLLNMKLLRSWNKHLTWLSIFSWALLPGAQFSLLEMEFSPFSKSLCKKTLFVWNSTTTQLTIYAILLAVLTIVVSLSNPCSQIVRTDSTQRILICLEPLSLCLGTFCQFKHLDHTVRTKTLTLQFFAYLVWSPVNEMYYKLGVLEVRFYSIFSQK